MQFNRIHEYNDMEDLQGRHVKKNDPGLQEEWKTAKRLLEEKIADYEAEHGQEANAKLDETEEEEKHFSKV